MKILFICPSLEEGSDGVGDYARRMSSEVIRAGHHASIIALNDTHLHPHHQERVQYDRGLAIRVLRLSSRLPWGERIVLAGNFIRLIRPDWISLQYVPYGFQKKGLPFGLGSSLKKITTGIPCHIMFHEMWVGITRLSPLKHKIYGFFQARIARDLVEKLNPKIITTSNRLYQLVLENKHIKAGILPLFSNISLMPKDDQFADSVYRQLGIAPHERQHHVVIGLFGSLYPGCDLESTIREQYLSALAVSKKLVFIAFGRIGAKEEYEKLKTQFESEVTFANLGELPEAKVSTMLQLLDKAISGTPRQHYGKSGVYAAMKLHRLEVLTSAWSSIPEYDREISDYNDFLEERPSEQWSTQFVSNEFLNMLVNSNAKATVPKLT
ncbi:glycosyltransferase [Dyadobacter chenwenxiniae]|uniref:Glycosyltransferase n=1 Tax=Dyadobacter chenwenxiniae TaxID=2906456 RepID=A0A9X1PG39_9BACT|nr:glycosyltransferase [Dyadobacter chenwenxiniae]MCF0060495.1 glycosyltransferase [Dyadobacter chenwenxiniae]UON86227.1 glycosyltransferase [Dyadobacter chenwenxiniae]